MFSVQHGVITGTGSSGTNEEIAKPRQWVRSVRCGRKNGKCSPLAGGWDPKTATWLPGTGGSKYRFRIQRLASGTSITWGKWWSLVVTPNREELKNRLGGYRPRHSPSEMSGQWSTRWSWNNLVKGLLGTLSLLLEASNLHTVRICLDL